MTITYLHQYFKFPNESGGTRSYDLAKRFAANGHKVEVVTTTSDVSYKTSEKWTTINRDGITVHYIYIPYDNQLSYLDRIIVFIKFMYQSTFKCLSIKSDCILATSTPLTIGIPALINKWKSKTPYIFEVRDVWPEVVIAVGAIKNKLVQKLLYKLEKTIYNNASAIVPLSSDMKHSIVSRYPNLQNKEIKVIENISEIDRFNTENLPSKSFLKEKGIPEGKFAVLYAGTFGTVNGIDYVIELAEKTISIDPNIIYILIGSGQKKDEVIEQAQDKNVLNKNVFILDSISKKDLPFIYSEIQMGSSFVTNIPELWANSANKFFDTLAAAKPILINYGGWQKEVIETDNVGYVLPPILNDESISDFVKYTQNKHLHSIQQKNALEKAKSDYSLDVATNKYIAILNNIQNNNV